MTKWGYKISVNNILSSAYFFNTLGFFFLGIISPIRSLVYGIQSSNYQTKRIAIIIFSIFYGLTLPITEKSDGYRHLMMVYDEYLDMSLYRFLDDIYKILSFRVSSSSDDLYKHFISFFAGRILMMPKTFFLWVSLIYGYFYSGVLLEVFKGFSIKGQKLKIFMLLFAALMILYKNFDGIQTVRTWTAMWVLIYAFIKYKKTKRFKYVLLLLVPPFIHFGFFAMAIPLYMVLLVGNRLIMYSTIFILSSFLNSVNLDSISDRFSTFELINVKIKQYGEEEKVVGDDRLDAFQKKGGREISRSWYKVLQVKGYMKWFVSIFVYCLIFAGVGRHMSYLSKSLYCAGLATLSGVNLFFFITAASNRMEIIGLILMSSAMVMELIRNSAIIQLIENSALKRMMLIVGFLIIIPKIIFLLSFSLSQMSFFTLMCPLVPILTDNVNISLIDVIKFNF